MSFIDDLRKLALNSVINPHPDYNLRHIQREYSKKFSTPLHEVVELPIEYVLEHYFEDQFEQLDESELRKQALLLIETEEERAKREREEEEFMEIMEQTIKEETKEKDFSVVEAKPSLKPVESQELPEIDVKIIENDEEFDRLVNQSSFSTD